METTIVTFPRGATEGTAQALIVTRLPDDRWGVVTASTPFHPVDHGWPDQPADRGTLAGLDLVDCVTGAMRPDGVLLMGQDIPVRRGDPGWEWVVVHVLAATADSEGSGDIGVREGDEVELLVDESYRRQVSLGHTATHLMALALNAAAAPYWSKVVDRRDSLGNPDFDSLAMAESRIVAMGAVDRYRLGKSLRKKGLRAVELLADLPDVERPVNSQLAAWVSRGGTVSIETGGDDRLTARRMWTAHLPDGLVEIPCGGTHVTDLAQLGSVRVSLSVTDDGILARTQVGD